MKTWQELGFKVLLITLNLWFIIYQTQNVYSFFSHRSIHPLNITHAIVADRQNLSIYLSNYQSISIDWKTL